MRMTRNTKQPTHASHQELARGREIKLRTMLVLPPVTSAYSLSRSSGPDVSDVGGVSHTVESVDSHAQGRDQAEHSNTDPECFGMKTMRDPSRSESTGHRGGNAEKGEGQNRVR